MGGTGESARAQSVVVRDLGGSLGSIAYYRPRRNYLDGFEEQPFIRFVKGDHVQLEYHGLQQELLKRT